MPLGNPVILYHALAMRGALHLFAYYTSATVWPFAPGHFLLASVLYLLRRYNQSSLNHMAYLFQEGRNTNFFWISTNFAIWDCGKVGEFHLDLLKPVFSVEITLCESQIFFRVQMCWLSELQCTTHSFTQGAARTQRPELALVSPETLWTTVSDYSVRRSFCWESEACLFGSCRINILFSTFFHIILFNPWMKYHLVLMTYCNCISNCSVTSSLESSISVKDIFWFTIKIAFSIAIQLSGLSTFYISLYPDGVEG